MGVVDLFNDLIREVYPEGLREYAMRKFDEIVRKTGKSEEEVIQMILGVGLVRCYIFYGRKGGERKLYTSNGIVHVLSGDRVEVHDVGDVDGGLKDWP